MLVTTTDKTNMLLTPKEAAKMLGVSRCTIYRWLKRGWLIKIYLPNGCIRIPQGSIDVVLAGK